MSIESEAEALFTSASSPKTSSAQLQEILDAHQPCFEGELCVLCEHCEEELGDLLGEIAGNVNLTAEQQDQVFSFAQDWQGAVFHVAGRLAENARVSDSIKQTLLDVDFIVSWGESREFVPELFDTMKQNERFTREDLESFKSSALEMGISLD
jgi:hypothetical protein